MLYIRRSEEFIFFILLFLQSFVISSCTDDESFTNSRDCVLTFEKDTVRMDTVFSNIPASTKSFWIHNNSGQNVRCSSVKLEHGNQSGFRVNVDGVYLGETGGFQTNDVEIKDGDSIRVFVELTAPSNNKDFPVELNENLVFALESGVRQVVSLNAWSWDAVRVNEWHVSNDTTIDNSMDKPLVVYGGIIVDSLATLIVESGSTLYFHDTAGIDVYGRLHLKGSPSQNVILRCDRLDRMFDYLPYDNLPGRWLGIRFHEQSYDNSIDFTDIHGAFDGIVCDSSSLIKNKLILSNSTIHNCQGYGLKTCNNRIKIVNSQITNTLYDCINMAGGYLSMLHTTVGQFYPFDGNRGVALRCTNGSALNPLPLKMINIKNSVISGYSNDVIMFEREDSTEFNYAFAYSLIRTPEVEDSVAFDHVVFEDVEDTICYGTKNFKRIDTDLLRYDFHLDTISKGYKTANPLWALPYNRDGLREEEDSVNMGCY